MASILIIEDNDQFRGMLQRMLQRGGHDVYAAVNGKQGLRMFYETPTEVVITDMLMPVMPGSKVISRLRKEFPELIIIAISGGGAHYQAGNFLGLAADLGADHVLQKPIRKALLLATIDNLLK